MKAYILAITLFTVSTSFASPPKKPFVTCLALAPVHSHSSLYEAHLYKEVIGSSEFLRVVVLNYAEQVARNLRGSLVPENGVLRASDPRRTDLGIVPGFESVFTLNQKLEGVLSDGNGVHQAPTLYRFNCQKVN